MGQIAALWRKSSVSAPRGGLFHARYEIIDSAGKVVLPMKFPPYDECAIAVESVGFSLRVHLPPLITGRTPGARKPPPSPDPPPRSPATTSTSPFRWQFAEPVVAATERERLAHRELHAALFRQHEDRVDVGPWSTGAADGGWDLGMASPPFLLLSYVQVL